MGHDLHPIREDLYDASKELAQLAGAQDPARMEDNLQRLLIDADVAHIKAAREDGASFCSYVLRDEKTNEPIQITEEQREWHTMADAHQYLIIVSALEAGKTWNISIGRTLYELGRNPNERHIILSATDGNAKKIVRQQKHYIEFSKELHRVFPKLRRGRGAWTDHEFTVEKESSSKDPSVQSYGIRSQLQGPRVDRAKLDDIYTFENARTKEQRDQVKERAEANLLGRADNVIVIGNAWFKDDALHQWADIQGWFALKYPLLDASGRSRWPERWPMSRIEQKRRILHPDEFARQFLCIPRAEDSGRFKSAWIDWCLDLGLGRALVTYRLRAIPAGYRTFTGVDLGVKKKAGSDLTVFFTILVHPNGDREVLCVESGRWSGPEILRKLIDTYHRFDSTFMVENVAAQDFILHFTRELRAIPDNKLIAYTTGSEITHPEWGIESMAAEMASKMWIIPCQKSLVSVSGTGRVINSEVEAWVEQMKVYDPRAHTGDRLMASFLAREAARIPPTKKGEVTGTDIRRR